jgi:hypothetical protein
MEIIYSVGLASGGAGDGGSFIVTVVVSWKINGMLTHYQVMIGIELSGGMGCMECLLLDIGEGKMRVIIGARELAGREIGNAGLLRSWTRNGGRTAMLEM